MSCAVQPQRYAPRLLPGERPNNISMAYAEWAKHYNECGACQQDDWFVPEPGEPSFCHKGRALFRDWVRLTRLQPLRIA